MFYYLNSVHLFLDYVMLHAILMKCQRLNIVLERKMYFRLFAEKEPQKITTPSFIIGQPTLTQGT